LPAFTKLVISKLCKSNQTRGNAQITAVYLEAMPERFLSGLSGLWSRLRQWGMGIQIIHCMWEIAGCNHHDSK
jgi:hypothetical protein